MKKIKDIDEYVDLIASGYEWVCPQCDRLNKEIDASNQFVKCENCKNSFEVMDIDHAY